MPKLPPVRVDTYADLKQLLDKEQMKLEGSVSEQINTLNQAVRSLKGAYAFLSDPKNHPNLFPYNKRTAAVAVKDALNVLNPKFAALKALRQKQLNFANRIVVPSSNSLSDVSSLIPNYDPSISSAEQIIDNTITFWRNEAVA